MSELSLCWRYKYYGIFTKRNVAYDLIQINYSACSLVDLLVEPEDGGGEFFRSICKRLQDYTALHSHHSRTVWNHVSFRIEKKDW
jgi:hypothetical protein